MLNRIREFISYKKSCKSLWQAEETEKKMRSVVQGLVSSRYMYMLNYVSICVSGQIISNLILPKEKIKIRHSYLSIQTTVLYCSIITKLAEVKENALLYPFLSSLSSGKKEREK